jgi:Ca-activated chloride channel family protein
MVRRGLVGRLVVAMVACTMVAAACSDSGGGDLTQDEALEKLDDLVDDTGWTTRPVSRRASVEPNSTAVLAEALPPIEDFPLVVDSSSPDASEIFVSSEKAGEGTDGWMVEAAEAFNQSGQTTASGASAQVDIRKIASGIGYQFIASGAYLPQGYSPSNQLWIEMARAGGTTLEPVSEQLVPNVAGIVLKTETADRLREEYGDIDPATMIDAVIQGDLVMGYTDPFASSTGLNFLLTVLDAFNDGDEANLLSPDVVSAFEEFQRNVPFVALTTLQIRESVEDGGTLDAFVMEYQTYSQAESLQSGFEFIPFGVAHDNPLYSVGDVSADQVETLELFAQFAAGETYASKASQYGFAPPEYEPTVAVPSGETLIAAQQIWKEKKDGGRPVVAVFVADVSGSMDGSRIAALQEALFTGADFITPETSVGLVTFSDEVTEVVPVAPFGLNQKAAFVAAVEDLETGGGTAMYDGVLVGLKQLLEAAESIPDAKPILVVLTDGDTTDGLTFSKASAVIEGLSIPVYTVGFEANIDELATLSSLVEAASLNAEEDDIAYKLGALFNAQL